MRGVGREGKSKRWFIVTFDFNHANTHSIYTFTDLNHTHAHTHAHTHTHTHTHTLNTSIDLSCCVDLVSLSEMRCLL